MIHARHTLPLAALATLLIVTSRPRAADKIEGPWGELSVALRYRIEWVSDDAPLVADEDALASTLRTALFYRTPTWKHFDLSVEFEDVANVGAADKHNNGGAGDLSNGVTDRPVIGDPRNTEVNQVGLRFTGISKTVLDAGRMEINLATERFVGAGGFRQNHQSFEALRATTTAIPRSSLTYAFLTGVNRTNGLEQDTSTHLLDVEIRVGEAGRLTPYLYALDYDNSADAGLSTTTWGARWQGRPTLGTHWTLPYQLELAQQSDAGDNPAAVDADYSLIEAGGIWKDNLSFTLGLETLGGSADDGQFQTPLATLHKFNGWADVFTVTPVDGLVDLYAAFGGSPGQLSYTIVYHSFESDSGSLDYGSEIDAELRYTARWKQQFALELASYDADELGADVQKVWATTSYRF